ncbi:MAG: HEPN domain-containing protein [bacterium]
MASARDVIYKIYKNYKENSKFLDDNKNISLLTDYIDNLSKTLLLCIASYFEEEIKAIVHKALNADNKLILKEFLENKALDRQFHTFFDWKANNANKFFKYFGSEFSCYMTSKVENDEDKINLKLAIKDFIEIGSQRNQLVHGNYATFSNSYTVDEIYNKYKSACDFIDSLSVLFDEFRESAKSSE